MSIRTTSLCLVFVLVATSVDLRGDLVAHWKLDEGSGSMFADSAGANDGYLFGGSNLPEFVADTPPTTFDNPFSLSFESAQQQYVQTTYEGIEDDNPRTISAWIKTESTAGQAIVAYGSRAADGEKWHFRVNPDGDLRVPGAIRTESQGGNQTGDTSIAQETLITLRIDHLAVEDRLGPGLANRAIRRLVLVVQNPGRIE